MMVKIEDRIAWAVINLVNIENRALLGY